MDRQAHLRSLTDQTYDLLVIGGGATGAGIALDAVTRGLKVALVEREDFAGGTSSKSTKLLHGGVRYLEKAVLKFDRGQLKLVYEALHERTTLLHTAPHLARVIAILTPVYRAWEIPYITTGLKMYDLLAGKRLPQPSRYLRPKEALARCPVLNPKGLRGGVLYYDGQFDDSRMNVCVLVKAAELGATILNYAECVSLTKQNGKIAGAEVRDVLSGAQHTVRAKVVINATGPFADELRLHDDPKARPMLSASSGAHIVLPARFSAPETGLLIPKTEDGRVLFLLPWLGHTLVGTTDNPAPIERHPHAQPDDIEYILRQLGKYFALKVTPKDILASWSGLRPLVADHASATTAALSRDHVIQVSPAGLVTIAGGKWTTYRRMAQDTVDEAILVGKLTAKQGCQTEKVKVAGGDDYQADGATALQREFELAADTAQYLHRAYGDRASQVAKLARQGYGARLAPGHPFLEAEVLYGATVEGARRSADVLARRLRLAFLDQQAAQAALPRVRQLLGEALGWDAAQIESDRTQTTQTMP